MTITTITPNPFPPMSDVVALSDPVIARAFDYVGDRMPAVDAANNSYARRLPGIMNVTLIYYLAAERASVMGQVRLMENRTTDDPEITLRYIAKHLGQYWACLYECERRHLIDPDTDHLICADWLFERGPHDADD